MTQAQHPQSVPRPDDDGFRDWATVRMNQLRRRAFLLSGSWYAADDLVQEALIAMYLSWTRIARSGNVDAYANRVLAGKFVDSTRRPWRREQPVGSGRCLLQRVRARWQPCLRRLANGGSCGGNVSTRVTSKHAMICGCFPFRKGCSARCDVGERATESSHSSTAAFGR